MALESESLANLRTPKRRLYRLPNERSTKAEWAARPLVEAILRRSFNRLLGQAPSSAPLIPSTPFLCRDDGMDSILRYFVTVRRATG